MTEIIEIYSKDRDILSYRLGDRFSNSVLASKKQEITSVYGEHYYYREIAAKFSLPEDEPLRIISPLNKVLWSE